MKRTYKTEGIILKRINTGEADRLVTILSRHYGKLRVIAKGVRRITSRRAPALELFNHTKFVLHKGKSLDYVSDATIIQSFSTVKGDMERLGNMYLVTELLDRLLADGVKQQKIFNVVLTVFTKLNDKATTKDQVDAYMKRFKFFLLENLGFIPADKGYQNIAIDSYIEEVIERRLKSKHMFT